MQGERNNDDSGGNGAAAATHGNLGRSLQRGLSHMLRGPYNSLSLSLSLKTFTVDDNAKSSSATHG